MNTTLSLVRHARRLLASISAGATALAFAQTAQPPGDNTGTTVPLDRYITSASRTPQDPRFTPSSVSLLSTDDLRAAQVTQLSTALAAQPGVILARTGAVGAQTSLLLRGANADQTLFVVDGVRMNDRSTSYLNFLGAADLGGLDRIEILRGPQSTLYGSSAMGGVILVNTTRGVGRARGAIATTAGSFDTFGASASVDGAANGFSYSGSLGRFETANDRPNNALRQWSGSTHLEYANASGVRIGGTFRGLSADYDEPGSRFYPAPGNVQSENSLATLYGEVRPAEGVTSRLTLASHLRQYTWRRSGTYSPQSNNRTILDWQNTWAPVKAAEFVAGFNHERSEYVISGGGESDRVSAGYLSGTLRPAGGVTIAGGIRYDHYRSAGAATTNSVGVAWRPVTDTKLHATYGTGFNAPATSDRYGVPGWGQLPNPNLAPEKSKGWDAGIEQDLAGGALTLGATYFQNRFRNLFEWEYVSYVTYEGRTANRARASTEGVELSATARPLAGVQARAAYTYLDARNDETGARLTRRPRHSGDAELRAALPRGWLVGAGVHVVAANMNGTRAFGGYTTARLFTSCAVTANVLLRLRIENALNRRYEEVYGYPALPRAVFGSAEWHF